MTTTALPPTAPTPRTAPRPHRRARPWALAVGILLASIVGVTAAIASQSHSPHSLDTFYGVNETWRLPVGTIAFIGGNVQPLDKRAHRAMYLGAVDPRVTVNTAHATVRVMECTVANPHVGVGVTPLSYASRICASLVPFRPGPVDLGFPATEIAYIVTPTTPGRVRVEGSDVSYLDGVRPGQQHAGNGFVLYVTPAKR